MSGTSRPAARPKVAPARRARRSGAAKAVKAVLPLTVGRPELLPDGTDREFRGLVHNLFAFMARHEAVRDGHARYIGLAGVEYTILISIGHLALERDVNVKTVADHLHMSGAFVTTVTSKLQSHGLVDKAQDPADRRRIALAITEKGKALLRRLAPFQREVNDVEFASLTREQFRLLSRIVEDLIGCGDRAVALQRYKQTDRLRAAEPAPAE